MSEDQNIKKKIEQQEQILIKNIQRKNNIYFEAIKYINNIVHTVEEKSLKICFEKEFALSIMGFDSRYANLNDKEKTSELQNWQNDVIGKYSKIDFVIFFKVCKIKHMLVK